MGVLAVVANAHVGHRRAPLDRAGRVPSDAREFSRLSRFPPAGLAPEPDSAVSRNILATLTLGFGHRQTRVAVSATRVWR